MVAIGVVFRGSKDIDGVLSARCQTGLLEAIASMLRTSRHQGQVRLIILDEGMLPERIDVQSLWEKTGKPVLLISEDDMVDPRFMFRHLGAVFTVSGIDEESAKRVLDVVYSDSRLEALRIAGIILESIVKLHNV